MNQLPPEILSRCLRWHATDLGQPVLLTVCRVSLQFAALAQRELARYAYVRSFPQLELFLARQALPASGASHLLTPSRLESDPKLVAMVSELRLGGQPAPLHVWGDTIAKVLLLLGDKLHFVSFGRTHGMDLARLPVELVSIDLDDISFPLSRVDGLPPQTTMPQIERLTVRNSVIVATEPFCRDWSLTLASFPSLSSLRIIDLDLRPYIAMPTVAVLEAWLDAGPPLDQLEHLAYYRGSPEFLGALLRRCPSLKSLQCDFDVFRKMATLHFAVSTRLTTLKLMRDVRRAPVSAAIALELTTGLARALVADGTTLNTVALDYEFYAGRDALVGAGQKIQWGILQTGEEQWDEAWGARVPEW